MGLWVGPRRRGAARAWGGTWRGPPLDWWLPLPPAALACRCIFLAPPPPPRRPPAHSWASGGLVLGMPHFFTVGPTQPVASRALKRYPWSARFGHPLPHFLKESRGGGVKAEPWRCLPATVRPPGLEPEPQGPSKLAHTWGLATGGCPATLRPSWVFEVPFHSSLSPQPEPWLNVPGEITQKDRTLKSPRRFCRG